MLLWLVCAPFIWDWRHSLSALRVVHFFFLRSRARRRTRKIRVRWALVATSRSGFPFPQLCFFSSLLPRPHWRARSSVFRFDGETMKSLSAMAIATSVGRNRCIGSFLFPLLFRELYKYIFFFFFPFASGLHRSIRGFHREPGTFDHDMLTATANAPQTRQNFLDAPRVSLVILSFLNFKNYQFREKSLPRPRRHQINWTLILIAR